MAGQDDGTGTGLFILDNLVSALDALLVVGSLQLLSELVLADGTDVDDVVGRQDVGGCSCGVLGCSTSDVGDLVVLDDIVVAVEGSANEIVRGLKEDSHSHVLFLGEDGIVSLQVVLLQQGLAVADLKVEQGVTHAVEEGVSRSGHDVDGW